jgi:hypothetical protein
MVVSEGFIVVLVRSCPLGVESNRSINNSVISILEVHHGLLTDLLDSFDKTIMVSIMIVLYNSKMAFNLNDLSPLLQGLLNRLVLVLLRFILFDCLEFKRIPSSDS